MAVSQSNIQSLLQDLSGVHTAGQAWVPNSGVSGNPNTAYNNPMPKAGAQAMQAPPMGDAGGFPPQQQVPWSVPSNNFQGAVDWQALAAKDPSNAVPGGFKGFPNILAGSGVGWKPDAVGIGTPPPVTPGTPPPGGTPPIGTGGNDPAQQIGAGGVKFNGPNDPLFTQGVSNGRGLSLLDLPPGFSASLYSDKQTVGSISSKDFLGGLKGLGSTTIDLGSAGAALGSTSLGKALGVTSDGKVDLAQILDLFVPGNVWMGQTHQTNLANIIPALAGMINPLLGFGVTKFMDYFGAKYANEDDSALGTGIMGWWRRMLRNRYMKNQANRAAAHGQNPGASLGGGAGGGFGGGSMLGGGWLGGGMPGFGTGGKMWVDSNGNPVDPGTFGSYQIDPQDPNNAYSGSPFGEGGAHPNNESGNGTSGTNNGSTFDYLLGGGRSGWGTGQGPNYK